MFSAQPALFSMDGFVAAPDCTILTCPYIGSIVLSCSARVKLERLSLIGTDPASYSCLVISPHCFKFGSVADSMKSIVTRTSTVR